ncbi:MAG: STAS domain-containing protein [Victivallales bacterium]|nr:STAS domain-containing protein [Victivallales bacterium]
MHLKVEAQDSRYILLVLSGRLDMAGVREVEIAFAENTSGADRTVLVDMTEVPFVASMGVRMLLSAAKRLHGSGKRVVLINIDAMVMEVLKMSGVESLFDFAADRETALSRLP